MPESINDTVRLLKTIKAFKDALNGEVVTGRLGDMVNLGELAILYPELSDVYLDFYSDTESNDYADYAKGKQRAIPKKETASTIFVNGSKEVVEKYFRSGYFSGRRPTLDTGDTGVRAKRDLLEGRKGGALPNALTSKTAPGLLGGERNLNIALTQLITHEIQHWVQQKEGWQPGANLKNIIKDQVAERYQQIFAEGNPKNAAAMATQAQTNEARAGLQEFEAQDYDRKLGNLTAAQQTMTNERDKVFEDDMRTYQ